MSNERTSTAIDWFMRLSQEEMTEEQLSIWMQWCADPENLQEFQSVRNMWKEFDQLGPAASELLETAIGNQSAQSLSVRSRARLPRYVRLGTLAAAVTSVFVAAIWYVRPFAWNHRGEISAGAELKSAVLPDGSALTLAPHTNVAVDFSGSQRALKLTAGEAYFKVRPDKSKPFTVHASDVKVTAIGTAFDVRSEPRRVTITVQEGVIEASSAAHDSRPWRVAVGQQIVFDSERPAARINAIDLKRAATWHEGRLEYFAAPLSIVVSDINRYSPRSIELGDPQLGQLAYTGSVFVQAVDDWLGGIQATFPVRAVIAQDGHVVLLNRSEPTANE